MIETDAHNRNTVIYKASDPLKDWAHIQSAAQLLRDGGLVVFPTETVYGLGANALDAQAVAGIFIAKGRPQDNPLIVHIAYLEQLSQLVCDVTSEVRLLAESFWPGPLTLVLPSNGTAPAEVTAGLNTIGIRMPAHPVARALLLAAGVPVAAPSANRSGRPSPTTAQHCMDDLTGRVDLILDGGSCAVGIESTVLSLAGSVPRLLRPGGVTLEELQKVLGYVETDPALTAELPDGIKAASPGMKYKHYAPRAEVALVHGTREQFVEYLLAQEQAGVFALVFNEDIPFMPVPSVAYGVAGDSVQQAQRLFSALRELDEKGALKVYARAPAMNGMGLAVYNRMLRAAAFREIAL